MAADAASDAIQELAWQRDQEVAYLQHAADCQDLTQCSTLQLAIHPNTLAFSLIGEKIPQLQQLDLTGSRLNSLWELGTRLQQLHTLCIAQSGLCTLSGIETLPQLRHLDASCNLVEDLAPLHGLVNLSVLDLEANAVSDIDMLLYLQDCAALTHLRLLTNPVCAQHGYRDMVKQMLPRVLHLDQHKAKQLQVPRQQQQQQQHQCNAGHSLTSIHQADEHTVDASCSRPHSCSSTSTRSRPGSSSSMNGTSILPDSCRVSQTTPAIPLPSERSRPGSSSLQTCASTVLRPASASSSISSATVSRQASTRRPSSGGQRLSSASRTVCLHASDYPHAASLSKQGSLTRPCTAPAVNGDNPAAAGLYWRKMRVDSLGASSSSSSAAAAAASGGVETQLSLKDEQHTVADIASFDGSDDPASQLTYGQETSLGGNVVWALRKRRQAAAQASIPAAAVAGAGKLQHQWAGSPNASSQDPTLLAELQHWRLDTASGLLTREHKSDMTPRHDDEGDVTSSQEHMSISAAGGV
eukprot:jgi/Chrzof1/4035/Cz13g17290.t1